MYLILCILMIRCFILFKIFKFEENTIIYRLPMQKKKCWVNILVDILKIRHILQENIRGECFCLPTFSFQGIYTIKFENLQFKNRTI